jgi:DNA-binding NarL/FixJ family response regulator
MRHTRVLLADDHTMVAQGLASLLREDVDLVGTVGDGQALIDAAQRLRPDVIVADLAMPVIDGLEALHRLTAARLDAKVLFLTMHADAQLATAALRAGASGYVLKHSAGEELLTAIQEVPQGRTSRTPLIATDVMTSLMAPEKHAPVTLTPRQREVLRLIAEGRRMKEIAALLQLSTHTVETHKYDMMWALGVQSTAELVRYAIHLGLVVR